MPFLVSQVRTLQLFCPPTTNTQDYSKEFFTGKHFLSLIIDAQCISSTCVWYIRIIRAECENSICELSSETDTALNSTGSLII